MNDLDKLAQKYGADKWGKHHYTPVYYEMFKDRRNTVSKVLEIGIAEGASLLMWRDFFPHAIIYGADIDNNRVMNINKWMPERIYAYDCDQSNKKDLEFLFLTSASDADLVVDDGSHKTEDQILTASTIVPLLKKGSIYVIEDVADPDILTKLMKFNPNLKTVGDRYDDRLIIIEK